MEKVGIIERVIIFRGFYFKVINRFKHVLCRSVMSQYIENVFQQKYMLSKYMLSNGIQLFVINNSCTMFVTCILLNYIIKN